MTCKDARMCHCGMGVADGYESTTTCVMIFCVMWTWIQLHMVCSVMDATAVDMGVKVQLHVSCV